MPAISNGARIASWMRTATASAAIEPPSGPPGTGGLVSRSASSSRNSSPPGRATRSVSRVASRMRSASDRDQLVARLVAERVVHELEVVEVDRDHGDPEAVAPRPSERELEQLVEHRAVRHARQLVVVREVGDVLLGRLALGDVEHHALDHQAGCRRRRSSTTAQSRNHTTRPSRAIMRYSKSERLAGPRCPARTASIVVLPVVRMQQVCPERVVADVLLGLDAEDRRDLRAHVDRGPLLVGEVQVDDRRDLLDERSVLRARLEQLAASHHVGRDVEHHPEPVHRRAVLVTDQHAVFLEPDDLAVAVDRAVLVMEGLAGVGAAFARRDQSLAIVRVHDVEPARRAGEPPRCEARPAGLRSPGPRRPSRRPCRCRRCRRPRAGGR